MGWVADCAELADAAALSTQVAERWQRVDPYLERAAKAEGVAYSLLAAVAWVESRWNPGVTSRAGAQGLMQVIPTTGKFAAAKLGLPSWRPWNVEENAMVGAWYLARVLHRFRDRPIEWGIAAYNAGPGAVLKRGPMAAEGNYPTTVLKAERAIRHARERCEQGGGGTVPVWPYPKAATSSKTGSKSSSKSSSKSDTPPELPAVARGGGALALMLVVMLALLFGRR